MINLTQEVLNVNVLSPQDILFSGPATSVSSKHSSGNFDLLPRHANFVTFIENYPITIIKPDGVKITFKFPMGIIHIANNQVKIYAQPELPKV